MNDLESPPRRLLRSSLDQVMIVILIMALCLAPLMVAVRSEEGDRVLGAVLFDVVVIPACGMLAVAIAMKPGPKRTWCLKAFLVTPLIFLLAMLILSVPLIIIGAIVLR